MKRDAQALLLLLIGGMLIKISVTGTYLRYVKAGLLPLLLVAGGVLVVFGAATAWQVIRASRQPTAAPAEGPDAHPHPHDEPRVAWLLLAPTLTLLLFAPPALGSYQANRNGTALPAQASSDFPPLPDGDPVRVSVLDYASRAVFDKGRTLHDRRVSLSGFVIAGPEGQRYLARMIVTCCAADARPIKVGLAGGPAATVRPDEWIDVEGRFVDRTDKDPVNGEVVPYLEVSSVRTIAAPKQQYES